MRRLATTLLAGCLLALCAAAPAEAHHPSLGNFGINNFDLTFTNKDGTPATQAGSHPYALTVSLGANLDGEEIPEGRLRDFIFEQVPGFVGDTTAYPRCTSLEFLQGAPGQGINACPLDTTVGITAAATSEPGLWSTAPVFNLVPPPGVLLRLGFRIANTENIIVDVGVKPAAPFNALAAARNTAQLVDVFGSVTQLWGNPSDPDHDPLRGVCGVSNATLPPTDIKGFDFEALAGGPCDEDVEVAPRPKPFLTLPTDCSAPLFAAYEALSWEGELDSGGIFTHDSEGNPQPFTDCESLGFQPSIQAKPTSKAVSSPSGLDFSLDVKNNEGLTSVTGRSQSDIRKAVVTLPEGMTANPSLAEGLEVCSEADLEAETLAAAPGEGCPEASKIGSLEVESPLVEEPIKGSLFVAKPFENLAGNSLIALYMVLKNQDLGVLVKQPAKVVPDPATGQLTTIADDIPQLPFSHFTLHFREGGRSPLVTPPLCGNYEAKAVLTPWSGTAPIETTSAFTIGAKEGASCPGGGTPPFEPGFEAGSQNNAAGHYSPFDMRLTRRDGDQDLTRFDATLPPGVVAKLAGVSKCSEAQIALAKTRSGREELRSPSCPANSKIGSVKAGAGVGSQLTYVPGSIYLAGPFGGAPLSVVAIVPAVAGPFDVGTVVTRQALQINPRTGEVRADGAHSDPIPHILAGIPLVVRDIQVYVDRPEFTINPTSCNPFASKASIWGGGLNPFSSADDSPVQREAPYQAASCASLGFKPALSLNLNGGTRRGGHPKLHSVFKPRPGDANLEGLILRLPRSAFLDQGHIRTICTRVQFAANGGNGAGCPPQAIYGHATALTPLLSEPLEGPVYLRSSNHNLPDFVATLHGIIDVEAVARIDSKNGGIRATFTEVPDAPISKVIVDMQGGAKGLIVNSTNLCAHKHSANAQLDAHNGAQLTIDSVVKPSCAKASAKRAHHRRAKR
jgi:hypothetical protein